jgi:hypothetical protein
MVVHMTVAKFKHLIFSVSGFALFNVANIFILMILDDFCLLPAWDIIQCPVFYLKLNSTQLNSIGFSVTSQESHYVSATSPAG